jgi:hypothetical protein
MERFNECHKAFPAQGLPVTELRIDNTHLLDESLALRYCYNAPITPAHTAGNETQRSEINYESLVLQIRAGLDEYASNRSPQFRQCGRRG